MGTRNKAKEIGKISAFLIMFFLFTTVFYFILKLTDRLPSGWNYLYVVPLTLSITLFGVLLKLSLK